MPPIGEEQEDQEINLDESMKEVYDGLQVSEEEQITPVEDTPEDTQDEVTETTGERARGPDGKFVAKAPEEVGDDAPVIDDEQPAEEVPGVEVQQDVEVETGQEPGGGDSVDPALANPPGSWTAEAKEMWKDVPARIRQEVMKRENESLRGVQQMQQRAQFGDRMNQVVTPYMPIIQAEGSTPEQTVNQMLNTAYQLRNGSPQNKAQLALGMAQKYGFLNELVASVTQGGQNSEQTGQLAQYLAPLIQRMDAVERGYQGQQQQAEQLGLQEAHNAVEAFATAVDESGSLLHPHFETPVLYKGRQSPIREVMAEIISAGGAEDYETAYDRAIWECPETRQVLQTQQAGSVEVKHQEEAKERALKAKKAQQVNISPKGTHETGQPAKPTGTVEETMHETMDEIRGRA